jgi:hypothetical protein
VATIVATSSAGAVAPALADDAPPAITAAPAPTVEPAAPTPAAPTNDALRRERGVRPPPLHLEYAQWGVAIAMEFDMGSGRACPDKTLALDQTAGATPSPRVVAAKPCILGSGGGLVVRAGYRSPGPWYIGGAYEFVRMDSSNLYRLGIFQQLRGELRYLPDIGYRVAPYVAGGLGAFGYGNEWGMETGGAIGFVGGGFEAEVSRLALLGVGLAYRPALIAGWTDTADQRRSTSLVHFLGVELTLEVRTEIGRRSAASRSVGSAR